MCNSWLLLNDMPVFQENLLRLSVAGLFLGLCSVGELNFSQDVMDEHLGITSVTESLFKVLFVIYKNSP